MQEWRIARSCRSWSRRNSHLRHARRVRRFSNGCALDAETAPLDHYELLQFSKNSVAGCLFEK
jgi:hypothetical protein